MGVISASVGRGGEARMMIHTNHRHAWITRVNYNWSESKTNIKHWLTEDWAAMWTEWSFHTCFRLVFGRPSGYWFHKNLSSHDMACLTTIYNGEHFGIFTEKIEFFGVNSTPTKKIRPARSHNLSNIYFFWRKVSDVFWKIDEFM